MAEHEHQHQCALIQWANLQKNTMPELQWLFAIPNGGKRSKAVSGKMKASGVRRGVYDLCLPVARKGYHALYIELKYGKNTLTPEQKAFKAFAEAQGNKCVEAWYWEEAAKLITEYLIG